MTSLVQSRALIVGIGDFGLWSQIHLWRRLRHRVAWRQSTGLCAAQPEDVLSLLTLRVTGNDLILSRPMTGRWGAETQLLPDETRRPKPEDLNQCVGKTMEQWKIASAARPCRHDVFLACVKARILLLQLLGDALVRAMGDHRLYHENQVQVTAYVICDATDVLASALLWPTLVLLRQVLDSFHSGAAGELIPILNTASYDEALRGTRQRAVAYMTLRELEFLSNSDPSEQLANFLPELVNNDPYWLPYLADVAFDRCYLMDNQKSRGAVAPDPYDAVVAIGNAVELLMLTDAGGQIRNQLSTAEGLFHMRDKLSPTGPAQVGEMKDNTRLQVTYEKPHSQEVSFRRGVYSSWGAASLCLPVESLDRWGESRFAQESLDRYLDIGQAVHVRPLPGAALAATPQFLEDIKGAPSTALFQRQEFKKIIQDSHREATDPVFKFRIGISNETGLLKYEALPVDVPEGQDTVVAWMQKRLDADKQQLQEISVSIVDRFRTKPGGAQGPDDAASALDVWAVIFQEQICNEISQRLVQHQGGIQHAINLVSEARSSLARQAALAEKLAQSVEAKFLAGEANPPALPEEYRPQPPRADQFIVAKWTWRLTNRFSEPMRKGQHHRENIGRFVTYRTYLFDQATYRLNKELLLAAKEHYYKAISAKIDLIHAELTKLREALQSHRNESEQRMKQAHDMDGHFLRTQDKTDKDLRSRRYAQWSQPIQASIQNQPLFEPFQGDLRSWLHGILGLQTAQAGGEAPGSSEFSADHFADCFAGEINKRVVEHGSWYDASFDLVNELIAHGKTPSEVIQDRMLRAQPFVAIEEDMFSQEVFPMNFVSLRDAGESKHLGLFAQEGVFVPVSTFDPYTITCLCTIHGLNPFMLPFVERCLQAYQALNDEDWQSLKLHQAITPGVQYANRNPLLQLSQSLLHDDLPTWQPPVEEVA